jgi:hypothetical protein
METLQVQNQFVERRFHKRSGVGYAGAIVGIAVGLILFATIGFTGLQLLATSATTSFQPTVVIIAITVVSILAALAVAITFLKSAGIHI